MLTYEEAIQAVLAEAPKPAPEQVLLSQAVGRVLAADALADMDVPPFHKALMDGYAVRSGDLAGEAAQLQVVGLIAAGSRLRLRLQAGQAAQIMTGAPVPEGADAVQQVEKTRRRGDQVEILEKVDPGQNMVAPASEVKRGQVVLKAGTLLSPARIGVLATFGYSSVPVYRSPSLAVASTGDEIVPVEAKPAFGQIRNSNAWMLAAQCRELGVRAEILPIVADQPELLRQTIQLGLEHDALVLTGGVSMGEFDYVPKVLAECGVEVLFHRVAIKPGKPVLIGRKKDKRIFGLPGNPVSAFVTFELFVRPILAAWMGRSQVLLPERVSILTETVSQKPGRRFYRPARTEWAEGSLHTTPIATQGSADLTGFSAANSLLVMEAEVEEMRAGERVKVLLLQEVAA